MESIREHAYIFGDLFGAGMFSYKNSRIFLEWKFLSFANLKIWEYRFFVARTVTSLLTDNSRKGKGS